MRLILYAYIQQIHSFHWYEYFISWELNAGISLQ